MKNKIILITGGATGIGLALCRSLSVENTVISVDRNPEKISALKKELPQVKSIRADVSIAEDLDKALAEVNDSYKRLDCLINNAGLGGEFDIVNSSEKDLMENADREMAVNYRAPLLLTKKALPLLKKSQEPVVVIVTSGLAYMPLSKLGTYCASKSAAHFMTLSLRHQLGKIGIRVVEVLPPVVDTALAKNVPMSKMSVEEFTTHFMRMLEKKVPVMNIGRTAGLEKFSRIAPGFAFKMLNKDRA